MLIIPVRAAHVVLVVTATLFAAAWFTGSAYFIAQATVALLLAGQVVGKSVKG